MVDSPSPLSSHLGYWLRYVSNSVSHSFARSLEALDVTVAEWVVLRELYDTPALSPSKLADHIGLSRGAITKLADRLIAKSLLVREANLTDARAQTLAITPAGRQLVPELSALADRNDADYFGHLSPEERRGFEDMLKAIVERRGLSAIPLT